MLDDEFEDVIYPNHIYFLCISKLKYLFITKLKSFQSILLNNLNKYYIVIQNRYIGEEVA